jgi:hypothetical protein
MNTGDVMRRLVSLGLALPLLMAAAPGAALAADTAPMATQSAAILPNPPAAAPAPLPETFAPERLAAPDAPDGRVHGMVSVGVGTNGYREAAVALNGQLANGAQVAIAIDAVQMNGGRVRRERAPQAPAAN